MSDRVQHVVMLVSFLVLTVTGLPQKYIYLNNHYLDALIERWAGSRWSASSTGGAATVLMVVTVFHLLAVAHRIYVRRVR